MTGNAINPLLQSLLTFSDAAKILGVDPVTVRRYVSTKKISHLKIGGRVRFKTEHIQNFIKEISATATKGGRG